MSDQRDMDEAPSRFAEARMALKEWWGQFTPEQQRRYLLRTFLVVLALVLLIGGCSVVRSYTTEKRLETGRGQMPAVEVGGPGAQFQGTGREGMPAGGQPPALQGKTAAPGAPGAPAAAAPGAAPADATGRSRMP